MLAALPMYDRPETVAATDRYWALIRDGLRARGLDAPDDLTRTDDPWAIWQSPDLVLAQTCGLPFRARLQGQVQLVGTPDYGLPGCAPGFYNSVVIARADDTRRLESLLRARVAINEGLSQSGWAALCDFAADLGVTPARPVISGGHRASARMVADGRADIAAIDAQTWAMLADYDGWASGLTLRARTRPTPGLPYICAPGRDAAAIAGAVRAAIAALDPGDRKTLGLQALVQIPAGQYLAQPLPPNPVDMPENNANPTVNPG
jgi:ABC-type phosphate/phosphonate transport system substrate-binding protein